MEEKYIEKVYAENSGIELEKNNSTIQSKPPKNGKKKQKNQRIGAIVATTVLACAVVSLSVGLGVVASRETEYRNMLTNRENATMSQAYYSLVDETNDMAVKFNKLTASNDPKMQLDLLYGLWKASDLAEQNLAQFSSNNYEILNLSKFINQLGGYCHTLALQKKGVDGLTTEEEKKIEEMKLMLRKVNQSLQDIQTKIEQGQINLETGGLQMEFENFANDFSKPSVEYPEMIYDGPFSDGLADVEAKFLTGETFDEAKAKAKIVELVGKESTINFLGEWNVDYATLNFEVINGEFVSTYAISKIGGYMVQMTSSRKIGAPGLSDEDAITSAISYAQKFGYENMESVWISDIDGVYYVNLAGKENSITLYPDLVKVKVASDDGEIIGFDAKHYILNHHKRNLESPKLSVSEARKKLKTNFEVETERLCLIPLDGNVEKLAYEFTVKGDGLYFIYVDAMTGEELKIMFVIDSENGNVLI